VSEIISHLQTGTKDTLLMRDKRERKKEEEEKKRKERRWEE
jgi:hypothetical protein